ncbi:MAG: hypothetical protein AAGC74_02585 [Verrucomicrobiota bacterium]
MIFTIITLLSLSSLQPSFSTALYYQLPAAEEKTYRLTISGMT